MIVCITICMSSRFTSSIYSHFNHIIVAHASMSVRKRGNIEKRQSGNENINGVKRFLLGRGSHASQPNHPVQLYIYFEAKLIYSLNHTAGASSAIQLSYIVFGVTRLAGRTMIWINILTFCIECALLLSYTPRLSGKHQLYYIYIANYIAYNIRMQLTLSRFTLGLNQLCFKIAYQLCS